MDSEILVMTGIVAVLFVIGLLALAFNGPKTYELPEASEAHTTAFVVLEPTLRGPGPVDCGDPVCGAIGHHLFTFESGCAAAEAGARVVLEGSCAEIPVLE